MSHFQNLKNRVVAGVVAQITELARRAAIDNIDAALSGTEARRATSTTTSASPGRVRGRGAKRSPDELDKLAHDARRWLLWVTIILGGTLAIGWVILR